MSKRYSEPAWVEDGMTVWLPWNREKGSALRCKVACAAGNHARVVNETYGVDKWVSLSDLLVPPGNSHEYGNEQVLEQIQRAMLPTVWDRSQTNQRGCRMLKPPGQLTGKT